MSRFKDFKGREWDLTLTVSSIKVVRERAGIDLGKLMQDSAKLGSVLFDDPEKFVNMLYVLCESQAKSAGVDDLEFGHGFGGETLEVATVALLDAIANFFPRSKAAQAIRASMGRTLAAMDNRLVREIEAATEASERELRSDVSDSPESPVATRRRERSAN